MRTWKRLAAIGASAVTTLAIAACSSPTPGASPRSGPQPAAVQDASGPASPTPAAPEHRTQPAALASAPIVTIEPWTWNSTEGPIEGAALCSSHYRLFVTLRQGSLKTSLPSFMETALGHYTTALGSLPEPPRRLESFIFGRRDQWASYTKARLADDASTYLALGRGGYTLDGESVLYDLGRWDTLTLAAHEGWHQYSQATFRHQLPIWLEEGVATYMEGHRWARGDELPTFSPWRNFERFTELRQSALADELIPLDELIEGAPQRFLRRDGRSKLLTYYAQVWALTHFLAEGEDGRYRRALEEVLQDAAAGHLAGKIASSPHLPPGRSRLMTSRSGRALILSYFNPDFAAFKKGYDEFVQTITQRGSGDLIWRGESPARRGGG